MFHCEQLHCITAKGVNLDLENQTMLALRMVNMGIRRQIEAFRNQNGLDAAAGTNGWVLGFLSEHENEDVYQRDLEKELGVCRSGISKLVATLEKDGLIERSRVASDDRLKKIVLTENGRAVTALIHENCRQLEEMLTNGFTPEETKQLLEYLDRMQHNLTEAN